MSLEDAWALKQADAGECGVTAEAVEPQHERGRVVWVFAAGFFFAAAVAQTATLFVRTLVGSSSQMLYDSLGLDIAQFVRAALSLACGVLLINRRTRDAACGLALSLTLIDDSRYFWKLRPSTLTTEYDALGIWLSWGVFALQSLGAVAVVVLLVRRQARRGARQRRADRIVAVLLGFSGAVLWAISNPLASNRVTVGSVSGGSGRPRQCCSWTQVDSWNHVAIVLSAVTMIALALVAATVRAKARAAGFLFGLALAPLGDVAWSITSSIAPMPSLYGFHYRQYISASVTVADTPAAGFWIGLAGIVLIAAAGAFRLLLGPREDRYLVPELTGTPPIG